MKNEKSREKVGFFAATVGIFVNITLFSIKLFAGIISNSVSITADAFNNLSDSLGNIVSLAGFKIASSPADGEHPHGHGRAEYIAGLIVSLVIVLVGVELYRDSFLRVIDRANATPPNFGSLSIIIMIAAIAAKIILGIFYFICAKKIKSPTLKAAGFDSLSDVISTSAVIIGAIIYNLCTINVDGFMGLLVATMIVITGVKAASENISPLLGGKSDPELVNEICCYAKNLKGIIGIHDLMLHNYGVNRNVLTFHAEVDGNTDFYRAHEFVDDAEKIISEKFSLICVIHLDPIFPADFTLKNQIELIVYDFDPSLAIHDFRKTKGDVHENLIFDIVVPFDFRVSDNEVIKTIKDKIHDFSNGKYCAFINIDKPL